MDKQLGAGRAFLIFLGFVFGRFLGEFLVGVIGGIIAVYNGIDLTNPESKMQITQLMVAPSIPVGFITGAAFMVIMAFSLVRNQLRDRTPTGAAWVLGTPKQLVNGALIGGTIACVTIVLLALLFKPRGDIQLGPLAKIAMTPGISQLFWSFAVLLLAPPIEELLFRGIIIGGFCRSFGMVWGGIGATILFLSFHLPQVSYYWPGLISVSILAFATLWIRLQTGAVGPAVALHFSYNLILVFLVIIGLLVQDKHAKSIDTVNESIEADKKLTGLLLSHDARRCKDFGERYQKQKDYQRAEVLYKKALSIAKETHGDHSAELVPFLNALGELYKEQSQYTAAVDVFEQAWESAQKAEKIDFAYYSPCTSTIRSLLDIYLLQENFVESETLYKEIIEINRRLRQEEIKLARWLDEFATLYTMHGKFDKAAPLYEEMLTIYQENLPPDHTCIAACCDNLAATYAAQKKYGEAEVLYRRALPIWKKQQGHTDSLVISSLNSLTYVCIEQEKYDDAEDFIRESKSLEQQVFDDAHYEITHRMHNEASLFAARGRLEEAEALYLQVIPLLIELEGADSPGLFFCRRGLIELYEKWQRYDKAEELYQQNYDYAKKAFPPGDWFLLEFLNDMYAFYQKIGEKDKADDLQAEIEAQQER